MCGGSGNVVTQDTILTDIESWISKFKHSTSYRAIDLYVNPYLKSYLTKGVFSTRWKWMTKYHVRVTLVADDKISLNEFHVTLAGSEIDITDAVLQGASLDELLEKHELEELKVNKPDPDQLEYTKKDRSGNGISNRNSGTKHPRGNGRSSTSKNTTKSNDRTIASNRSNGKDSNESRNGNSKVTVVLKKDQTEEV
jgi:ribonuclease G